jgi:putative hydrolase of the HAD superfamily
MIKAILFDLDNTLIDFMRMKRRCCEAAVHAMVHAGIPLSEKKALELLYSIYDRQGYEYNLVFQQFFKEAGEEIDYKILAYGITAYRKAQTGMLEPYPNVVPTLIKLREKGLKLAIVSDAPRLKAWIRLVEMRLESFFDLVIALDDTGKEKPDPAPFKLALEKLKMNPSNCMMVGDRPERDLYGARNIGIKTVFAQYGAPGSKPSHNDYVINDISELVKIAIKP